MNFRKIVSSTLFFVLTLSLTSGQANAYFQNSNRTSAKTKSDARISVKPIGLVSPGRETAMSFELESNGKVNVISFTVNFDPSVFKYVSSSLGSDHPETANLAVNAEQTAKGKFGILVDSAKPFEKGKKQILTAVFKVAPDARPGSYDFSFSAVPTRQGVATTDLEMLKTNYETGSIQVGSPRKAIVGRVLDQEMKGVRHAKIVLKSPDGREKIYVSGSFGYFIFDDLKDGVYTISVSDKNYSFAPRIVEVKETFNIVDFVEAT